MAKGYWFVRGDVSDAAGYKRYTDSNGPVIHRFGGRFLVRGGTCECPEGQTRSRHVIVEFPDYAAALGCYKSDEYQALIKVRAPHADLDFVVIEGYDEPQP
jgi:uncharacterized protein (DUF1330 family)